MKTNNLITIKEHKGKRAVSARELYDFLEIKDYFSQWIKRMFEYGFTENADYQAVHIFVKASNGIGGTNKTDYALTMDTAKEIAMIQRSPQGKQAREYFLACEKQLKLERLYSSQSLLDHTDETIQKSNSKRVNGYIYNINQDIQSIRQYNAKNCFDHTGKYPKELKLIAQKMGMKAKTRTSGKEVARQINPPAACGMSFVDYCIQKGMSYDEAIRLSQKHANPIFNAMLSHNMQPKELSQ